ncbi:MAG: hypothetical protein M0Q41_12580 [Bacteroidales bacterium]|nr:hypothetical protein [Bacteroidales bacterium]
MKKNGGFDRLNHLISASSTTLLNHYDKLETTETSQWTMDNGSRRLSGIIDKSLVINILVDK